MPNLGLSKTRPLTERFWEKVDIRGEDECWPWLASTGYSGYGQIWEGKSFLRSHRVAWMLTYGPIPEGMCVLHHCDNPLCCNPTHLFLGTNADNTADMIRKGRSAIGEKQGQSKLTAKQVREIRRRWDAGGIKQRELANEYGVSRGAITGVIYRYNWKHVR